MSKLSFIATTTFGLEATVKREVERLGFNNISVLDGRVNFSAEHSDIPKANIWLRSSDRVLLVLGEFNAYTFDELFEKTKALPWDEWIPQDGNFTVNGKSVKSKLFSVPDCQSIVKKAVVEKLKMKYKTDWFEETGASYTIQVALLKDTVTLTIDTTGSGLHKRGYRETAVEAPLKETLAASLIELSYWKPNRLLIDPFCGSGTIPIEAALMGKNIAPGLSRKFVSEDWVSIPQKAWKDTRKEAYEAISHSADVEIIGYDSDPWAIKTARLNAERAGVDDCVRFEIRRFEDFSDFKDYTVVITNPPYGERLGTTQQAEELYRLMGSKFTNSTWSVYVITSHEQFEQLYGNRANKKRKLFNGRIKIDYYQFHGKIPPKQ